jgi:monooxygenase
VPLLGLTSGYVQRGSSLFPKQGSKSPWLLRQNYILDLMTMRFGAVDDGAMVFSKGGDKPAPYTPTGSNEADAEAATASA